MSIEALILGAVLIACIYFYGKIQEPKLLRDWAEKSCSYMSYGEVIVHLAKLRANLKEYGFLSDKERALLNALETRQRALKGSATPDSILKDIQHYALMVAPERAIEIHGNDRPQEKPAVPKSDSISEQGEQSIKPHYHLIDGQWIEKPRE